MKKLLLLPLCLLINACAVDSYKLKINNDLENAHGQSIYFRSSLRSNYAGQIRRVLSNKFAEMGIKTATSTDNADYIAIFDIETFYRQTERYKGAAMTNSLGDSVLFSDEDDSSALYFSGNANMRVDRDQTCFTLNIGRKGTSKVNYASTFCSHTIAETEDFVPLITDLYGKYATYQNINSGVQCLTSREGAISCEPIFDRQQAFINSLWSESDIGN